MYPQADLLIKLHLYYWCTYLKYKQKTCHSQHYWVQNRNGKQLWQKKKEEIDEWGKKRTVARRYVSWATWIGNNTLIEMLTLGFPLCLYQLTASNWLYSWLTKTAVCQYINNLQPFHSCTSVQHQPGLSWTLY